jgi:glutaredoxin-related protein
MNREDTKVLLENNDVVIFGEGEKGEPISGPTAQVQEIFDELAPDYIMVNVADDKDAWEEILSEIVDEWNEFPVVFVHGRSISDFEEVIRLEEEGELEEMLA